MKLTQIEINGFKSFAKKQALDFSDGITAIIGPNGCGKSNIADAFRFVLGEQSARALRGKKVEDFIFGGTEKRRPLSYCEVSIHFDNSDGELNTPYTEVTITRRAYRSGESEYYINKAASRLKDIHELFRDTGVGKDGYSIIGQGRVSEIISEKSNERRVAFEEAAGVNKYRARKEEAERKLLNTQKNLVRLDDILVELEGRIEPLREQSEKAIRFLKLRDELKDIEVNLFIYQYERSGERIKQLSGTIDQLKEEIASRDAAAQTLASSLSEAEDCERRLSASIGEVSQKLLAATADVESHAGEERVVRERIASLSRELERINADSEANRRGIDEKSAEANKLEKSLLELVTEVEKKAAELEAVEAELTDLDSKLADKEAELDAHKQSMMDRINSLSDAKSLLSRLDEMKKALNGRIESILEERRSADEESIKLSEENAECESENEALGRESDELSKENLLAAKKINELNSLILDERNKERKLEGELESLRSRSRVLAEMKRSHEGYYSSVRDLLRDAERDRSLSPLIEGAVAELIKVPAEYETAIEMALGSVLQNIVVPTEQDAKKAIEYLRSKKYGRATFLPVSAMRSRLLTNEEHSCIKVDGCFGVASDLIEFSPRYRGVIENILGRTIIVRDLDVGIAINKRAHASFRIATLQGDIMNPGGSMTGGSAQKREFSLLGREREIEELKKRAEGVNDDIAKCGEEIKKLEAKLESANADLVKISEAVKQLAVRRAALNEKHEIVLQYIEKNRQRVERFDNELSAVKDNLSDIDEQARSATELESGLSSGNASTQEDIKRVQAELYDLRAVRQETADRLTALKVDHMAVNKEQVSVSGNIARLRREISELTRSSFENVETRRVKDAELKELGEKLESMSKGIVGERTKVDELTDERRGLEDERDKQQQLVDELRSRRDSDEAERNELRERMHRNELNMSRLTIELDNMTERIWQEYELTYENALPFRHEIQVTASHQRSDALKSEIRSLGEVNTSSVEDYKNVVERHTELKAQCEDLKKAEDDLNEIIRKLTVTMEKEFAEQFRLIRENFSRTFTELFHGGRAELRLADEHDILNCDIDIIAQPPGKKLQLLSLLSGGEQALTAIALLFAILKLKPTAFCILDEIDTSLDEANVDNYADYLKDYSNDTQFIIITHRKGAMAVCDSLYGVSMEEKGVSQLISARFNNKEASA
ncbi:MAG: chromosome segregation protein SMC [Clostridiales bacterium]|nr:chromosome segregation protein SMC [Clostridiales bacterium]